MHYVTSFVQPFFLYELPNSNIREVDLTVDEFKRIRDVKLFKSVHIMAREKYKLTYY